MIESKEELYKCLFGESYEKCLNIKEQQITKNLHHSNEVESSIL